MIALCPPSHCESKEGTRRSRGLEGMEEIARNGDRYCIISMHKRDQDILTQPFDHRS